MPRIDKRILVVVGIVVFWILAVMVFINFYLKPQQQLSQDETLLTEPSQEDSDTGKGGQPNAGNLEDTNEDNVSTSDDKSTGISDELEGRLVAQKVIAYINSDMLTEGNTATSDFKTTDLGRVYSFKITVDGSSYDVYATADGKLMFPQAVDMTVSADNGSSSVTAQTMSARPDVKVFVMSYCPYGLQAQKMYLPVYELLKSKADMGIYFVNYIMHGKKEIDENLRQYCIQKEQTGKYAAYLKCFTGDSPQSGGGNYSTCLDAAGVDKTLLEACITATDEKYGVSADYNDKTKWLSGNYPVFTVHDLENEEYGVQGSPTIIINGQEANLDSRSPQGFLEAVCAAFDDPPAECDTKLSDTVPSTGFGSGVSTGSGGGCGG